MSLTPPNRRPISCPLPLLLIVTSLALLTGCSPSEVSPELSRGLNALDEQRFELARWHLERYLEINPTSDTARLEAARAWSSGPFQSTTHADDHRRNYLSRHPEAVTVRLDRATSFLGLGRNDEAFREVKGLPSSPEVLIIQALALEKSDAKAALARVELLLDESPDNASGLALGARLNQVSDPERALHQAERAIARNPFDQVSTYIVARLRRAAGDTEGAQTAFAVHQELSDLEGTGSKPEPAPAEALEILERLATTIPTNSINYQLRLAELLVINGQPARARAILSSLPLHELSASRQLLVGRLAGTIGEVSLSKAALEAVLERSLPATLSERLDLERLQRAAYAQSARIALSDLDSPAAMRVLDQGLEMAPFSSPLLALRAELKLQSGHAEEAEDTFRRLMEVAPWRDVDRLKLADLLIGSGRFNEVGALLDQAPEASSALDQYRLEHSL
ncbi:MAG: hypothetical protein K8J08_08735 [Thermoanaerobaculia bacterium]|nr:hypothetical protein [Thermoanaerobaculia bacterium]